MVRIGRGFKLSFSLAAQGHFARQTHDAVTAHRKALRRQFRRHAWRAIRRPALRMHRLDGDLYARVFRRPLRRFGVRPSMESTVRHVKNAAQNSDRVFESQCLHDRVLGSGSRAKHAAAFFTMSHSMRVSASSLRSLLTSASSSGSERLPGATLGDVPRFATATQLARVPLGMVRRSAGSFSVRPCVRTSFTASSRSLGV